MTLSLQLADVSSEPTSRQKLLNVYEITSNNIGVLNSLLQ